MLTLLSLMLLAAAAQTPPDVSPFIAQENHPALRALAVIVLENRRDGGIFVKEADNAAWRRVGTVLLPAARANKGASVFTATKWGASGTVVATAVNALHIKTGTQPSGEGIIFSILPVEFYAPPKDYNSYLDQSSALVTDVPAGDQIFGRGFAPYVGNPVQVSSGQDESVPPYDRVFRPMPDAYEPRVGDTFRILINVPDPLPTQMRFENRFGGLITLTYGGEERVVGQVLRPVQGVGRFGGTLYLPPGRIRANHPGVIDVSTSPIGQVGGFQIIPAAHGMSPEMWTARQLTQWMVIGPVSALDPPIEGLAPFFRYYLRPDYHPADLYDQAATKRLLQRYIAQVRIKDGPWQRMPSYVGRVDDALKDVTHIRILFPIFEPAR